MITASEEKVSALQKQLEYYFSDENLSKDSFFHEKIAGHPEGYLDIDIILKCNKIIKLGSTKDDLVAAASKSNILEVSKDSKQIRRLQSMPLPELKLTGKKRSGTEGNGASASAEESGKSSKKSKKDKQQEMEERNEEPLEAIILTITCDTPTKVTWKEVFNKFKENNPGINVVYFRFDSEGKEGNAGVFKKEETLNFKPDLQVGDTDFKVKITEGKEVEEFWTKHGTHFELCLSGAKRMKNRFNKNQNNFNVVNLKEPISLGNEAFTELPKIKVRIRKLLSTYKDNQEFNKEDHSFTFDLLKVFNKNEEKQDQIKNFVIAPHRRKGYYRTFFSVYEDGTRDEFSVQKCIEKIQLMNAMDQNKKKKRDRDNK